MAQPILLVFLRHLGCTFARKALSDLSQQRLQIESRGVKIYVVNMSPDGTDGRVLDRFGWPEMNLIRDPEQRMYEDFSVPRGTLAQVLPPEVLLRGLHLAITCGFGIGRPRGDCMQLGSVFFIEHGEVTLAERYQTSGEQTDFITFVSSGLRA